MMGSGRKDNIPVFPSPIQHMPEDRHISAKDDPGCLLELHLLHIVGKIPTGHALMDMFGLVRCLDKTLNLGFDIVFGFQLPLSDKIKIDVPLCSFIALNHIRRDRKPQFFLGPHHCDPELAFRQYPSFFRKDPVDFRAGVSL